MRTDSTIRILIAVGLWLTNALALAEPPMNFQHLNSQDGLP